MTPKQSNDFVMTVGCVDNTQVFVDASHGHPRRALQGRKRCRRVFKGAGDVRPSNKILNTFLVMYRAM